MRLIALIGLLFFASVPIGADVAPSSDWKRLTQAELNAAYDQSVYAPNLEQVLARFDSNSDLTRAALGDPIRIQYGSKEIESFDLYPTSKPNAPIQVFIHGGAWKLGSASQNGFHAENFVNAGAHFIVPDFSPVQDFQGNLEPMVEQLTRCLIWIFHNAQDRFDGDPNRIFLSGFSSGGHLAGVLLTIDWSQHSNLPADLIKGGLLCSGLYDLEPVSLSFRSEYVNLGPEVIERLSPLRRIGGINCPVIVAFGTYETPEFQRQGLEFVQALQEARVPHTLLICKNYNHFEVIETLANPYSPIGKAVLNQMGLSN